MKFFLLSSLSLFITAAASDRTITLRGSEQLANINFVKSGASISCNGPAASRPCPDAKPLPYTCDGGASLCCVVKPADMEKLFDEVDLNPYGTCTKEEVLPSVTKVDEIEFVDAGASISCNGPAASRPCPDAKPLPYTCDGGASLCCVVKPADMEKLFDEVDLNPYGTCTKDEEEEEVVPSVTKVDEIEFVDASASISCNGPGANRPCPSAKPLPYACDDGSSLCCVVTPASQEKVFDEVNLDPFGICTREKPSVTKVDENEYVDASANISCNGPGAKRPCPSAKPLPYTCDDGSSLCCVVTPANQEKVFDEVELNPYGTCTKESSPATRITSKCCDPAEGPGGCPDENGSFDNCWDEGGYCCSDGKWYAFESDGSGNCQEKQLEDSEACITSVA